MLLFVAMESSAGTSHQLEFLPAEEQENGLHGLLARLDEQATAAAQAAAQAAVASALAAPEPEPEREPEPQAEVGADGAKLPALVRPTQPTATANEFADFAVACRSRVAAARAAARHNPRRPHRALPAAPARPRRRWRPAATCGICGCRTTSSPRWSS